jgi:uncharacterized protein (TIGR03437 family)
MKSLRALILLAGTVVVCAFGQTPAFNTGQAARLIIGQKNFTAGDFGATNQLIGSPGGLALANGSLWVVDANRLGSTPNNNRVLRFSDVSTYPSPTEPPDISGSTCGACRGTASQVLGQPDFIGTNPNLSANGLRDPTGVATDGNVLVVSDTDNNRVLIWLKMPTGNGQPADVVVGQANFTSNATSVPPTQTSLRGPEGVWIYNGKLFIADTQDNRILIYNKIPTTNHAPADVVVGQANFTAFVQPDLTASQPTTAANNMQSPTSVATDGTHLFVSDLGQNRVLIFNSIPTTNGASADIAIGQPNLVSSIANNSFYSTGDKFDADNNPIGATPVLCQSNGTDATTGTATFPARCAATLEYPRFVLSDGKRLFVADGGNDRVLVFNSIPTTSGTRADTILGQVNEFSDNTGLNPDGTDAFQTPTSLAWDGSTNLYVSDGYNRRVVVYSPGVQNVPLDGIRNAASQQIYAIGSVSVAGSVQAKDTVTITIGCNNVPATATATGICSSVSTGVKYTYTVVASDTLESIVQGIVNVINKAPDPNVVATADISDLQVVLTARQPGANGGNITLTSSASSGALVTATVSGATLNIYLQNPSQIAPGTVIEVNGQNLCDASASGDFTRQYLSFTLNGCTLYVDGVAAPLLFVSPTQINAQMMFEAGNRTSVSIYVRNQHPDGSVTATTPVAATIVPQNPGIFAQAGSDPRPGIIYHGSSSGFDLIGVDGSIQAGDVGTLAIGSATYSYTVQAGDTLASVRDGLIAAINSAPDPNVYAAAANEYYRLTLTSITPGPQGEGTAVTASVTTAASNRNGATLLLTAYNSTMCCSNVEGAQVTEQNPAIPGEMLYLFATGLGVTSPQDVDTGRVFPGGSMNPLVSPVDSILTGGTTANPVNVGLAPGTVGVYFVQFLLNSGLASNKQTQMTIAQKAFVSNVVTFPVSVPGLATTLVVTPDSTSVPAGTPMNFTVTALDYTGKPATSFTDTVAITSSDPGATLPANAALSAGVGVFSVTLNTGGLQTVTATDTTATSVTGTSPGINVTGGSSVKSGARRTPRKRPR